MATRIPYNFAEIGDRSAIPSTPSGTELSWQAGWTPAYELPDTDAGYRYVDRTEHNYIWYVLSSNIKEWQEQIYPEWNATIAYPQFSIVKYSDDVLYICYLAAGSDAGSLPDEVSSAFWMTLDDWYSQYDSVISQLQSDVSDNYDSITTLQNQQFGIGQTRQNLTASRVVGNTYQNTTNKAIKVLLSTNSSSATGRVIFTVGGLQFTHGGDWDTGGGAVFVEFTVLPGESYSVDSVAPSLNLWVEIR